LADFVALLLKYGSDIMTASTSGGHAIGRFRISSTVRSISGKEERRDEEEAMLERDDI